MKCASLVTGMVALGLSAAATADIVGVTAGVTAWKADYSGNVRSGPARVDLENDLGLSDEWYPQGYAAIEHPVPLLPNLKLQYTELSQTAKGSLGEEFDGVPDGAVDTDLDLTHSDVILYYEVLDNVVSIDVGVNLRIFDGELVVTQRGVGGRTSRTDIDEVVPMLYVAPSVSLPFTGWSIGGEVSAIKYSDNRLVDVSARIRYEMSVLGIEAGWRQMDVKLDDIDDLDADVKVAGPYLGLVLDF